MHRVLVSDRVRAIIDHHVASGTAESRAAFIEEAVLRHAALLEGDDDEDTSFLIVEAEKGIADIEAGRYVDIACPADAEAFWTEIKAGVERKAAKRDQT